MDNQKIQSFSIIGIAIRTTNEHNQSSSDIPALWNRFIEERIIEKIPNKVDDTAYSLYTDYEKDHTRPYTTILGCRVKSVGVIPEGFVARTIGDGVYAKYVAKGNLLNGVVYHEWIKIWNSDIDRAYSSDFEVYGEKAQNPQDAEVEIFIAINQDGRTR
jgi:predicted transcriptional regulator YdeE